MNQQKSNRDLMIAIISIIVALIGTVVTAEYTIVPKYFHPTFLEMLFLIFISVLIIIILAAFIYLKMCTESIPPIERKDIRKYIRSLNSKLMIIVGKRGHNLFIGKISENLKAKRRIGRELDKKETSLIDIIKGDDSLVAIRGTGGMGKTFTLWKWIMDTCNNIDKDLKNPGVFFIKSNKVKIPVYIPLRDMKVYDYIETRIKEIMIAGDDINPFFDELVKDGKIIFIFDGLNEISLGVSGDLEVHVKKTMNDLVEYWQYLSKNTECKIVVTCRDIIPYYEEKTISDFFQRYDISNYEVIPLSHSDIEDILKGYLKINAPKFLSLLKERGEYDMVSDALRLSIAIDVFREDNTLPPPLKLYEEFIYKSIERNLKSGLDSPKSIDHSRIAKILEEVAYNIIKDKQSGASFPKSKIKNIIDSDSDSPVYMEHLTGCGFLEEEVDGSLRFWQQHWNEVFASLKIIKSDNLKEEIKEKITDERWYGTLIVLSRFLEKSDYLIESAIQTKTFDLTAKIIKNASVKNVNLINIFLLNLTRNLNEVRILTCRERKIEKESSEKYDKILYTCFNVVEILGDIALEPFMDMCTNNNESIIRAQGIYFIEEERDLIKIMTNEKHVKRLLNSLKKETNIHVIFHILIVLEEFLQRNEIKNEIQQEIIDTLGGWKSTTKLQAKLILRRNKLLSPLTLEEKTELARQFKIQNTEAKRLIDCLKTFEDKTPNDRNTQFNEILENLEPILWLVTELANEELNQFKNEATELLSYAVNENTSPFWIVRWWAIFNLGKIGTESANQLLFENIKDQLIDIGLLCIKRLSMSTGGDEYIRNFISRAGNSSDEKKIEISDIRLREAKHALEMHI